MYRSSGVVAWIDVQPSERQIDDERENRGGSEHADLVTIGRMKLMAAAALAAALASAQWLNTPMPGVPRTPDGKVDVSAPAPKNADGHPDLTGVWTPNSRPLQDLSVGVPNRDVPYLPWS